MIDFCYISFYKFFSTIKWFEYNYVEEFNKVKDDNKYDWIENKIFIEKYKESYFNSIIKLLGKKKYINSYFIFCMDSSKENLWRKEIDETYKQNRYNLSYKYNFSSIFKYTYNKLLPSLIELYKGKVFNIKVLGVEADDIIAVISNYIYKFKINCNIYILSADKDFYQLGRYRLFFINFKDRKVKSISRNEANEYLLKKICLGDKSDNISSIMTKKTFNKNKSNINLFIEESNMIEKYNKNKNLVDFNCIPNKYYDIIVQELLNCNIV